MDLQIKGYSVLVVSGAESFNNSLASLLSGTCYGPVKYVNNISAAKRAFAERSFDLVLINSPLQDDPGLRFSIDLTSDSDVVVLLIVRSDMNSMVAEKMTSYGVFTMGKPISRHIMETALGWMTATSERLRMNAKKTISIEEKMKEIRQINRAKWVLISELKMDEARAHRFIEKQAMDRCMSRAEIAEDIIRTYT